MRSAVRVSGLILAVVSVLLGACDDEILQDQSLEIDATGTVLGSAFADLDGDGQASEPDAPLAGVEVAVIAAASEATVASGTTDENGVFIIPEVPVGTFRMRVDSTSLPDSLELLAPDPEPFLLGANDTVSLDFRVSFPSASIPEVLELEPGRRVFTHGIALSPRDFLGDGVVHFKEGDAFLRATAVERVQILPGDSVRMQGRTAREAGLPILTDVRVFVLRQLASIPRPLDVSTAVAARADEGTLNGALVRIREGEILDTATVQDNFVVTLDDGSGPVEMVFRDFLPFNLAPFEPSFAVVERGVGLLEARRNVEGDLRWRLLPRFPSDVTVADFPLRTVAQVRAAGPGLRATVEGIVLNPTGPDRGGVLHLREEGVHVRVRETGDATLLPGDSVRIRGTTASEVGLTVLDLEKLTLLKDGASEPRAVDVSTGEAAAAGGGARLDAALVRISSAEVVDTERIGEQFVATVDDGTGPVDLVFRSFVDFNTGALNSGTTLEEAVGLLVAQRRLDGTVRWRVLPRVRSDVSLE